MTKLVFLLGTTEDQSQQQKVRQEWETYGDIVQGVFHDSYHNLTYKNIFGLLWVSNFCEQAEFVVKTDDDMYVDMYEVFPLTNRYKNHTVWHVSNILYFQLFYFQAFISRKFLLCPVFRDLEVIRNSSSKWFVSYEEIDKATQIYPPTCTGWFYILTPTTAARLLSLSLLSLHFLL